MTDVYDVEKSIEVILDARLDRLNTCLPAFVNSYNPENQTAEVQPIHAEYYLLEDGTKELQQWPAIPNVPVLHPRSEAGFYIHLPVKKGSLVFLICSQRSLDEWFETDGKTEVIPEELTTHGASDFVALPMGSTNRNKIAGANADDLLIGHTNNDVKIRLEPDGTVNITASRINLGDEAGALALALAQEVNDNFTAFRTAYNAHIHIDPLSGVTGIPTVPLGSPGDVSSEKVFTDS